MQQTQACSLTTPVLIVGGGPTGLAMALLLHRKRIPFKVVERNPSITDHPRARGVWARTMELFRGWGIEQSVRAGGLPDNASGFAFVESLTGREYGRAPKEIDLGQTPAWRCTVSQDVVEKQLLDVVNGSPWGSVSFGTEFLDHKETSEGATARVRDVKTGAETVVAASYLIACDGAGSGLRRNVGIEMIGPASLAVMNNDYWQADLSRIASVRQIGVFRIFPENRSEPLGSILNTNGFDKWLTLTKVSDETGQVPERRSDAEVVRLARLHTGIPDLDVKIINRSVWRMSLQVAATYSKGRVFLVGDAAHRFPPSGGYGMNTGIQDAHNLAWKLALVLRGQADKALLDTYDQERRPVGKTNSEFQYGNAVRFSRMDAAHQAGDLNALEFWIRDSKHHSHSLGLDLGFHYQKGAIVPDGSAERGVTFGRYDPADRPGHRFPHVWLDVDRQRSTLDLFDDDFVLLHGPTSADWKNVTREVGDKLGLRIHAQELQTVDPRDGLEMSTHGAVLVRPDGVVAWRTPSIPRDPRAELASVLNTILRRNQT